MPALKSNLFAAIGLLSFAAASTLSAQEDKPAGPAETDTLAELEARFGETPVTRAIDRALELLARTQEPDGSWKSGFPECTGVAAIACLAFLSAGHLPGRGKYGQVLDRGIQWILSRQQPSGLLTREPSRTLYSHGMSALLLGEVYGLVDEDRPEYRNFEKAYRQAIDLILQAQNVAKPAAAAGGWRYDPASTDSDLSAAGWQLMALRAAFNNGLPVPQKSIEAALAYVKRCALPTGEFCYMPGQGPSPGRTGIGLLCLQICGAAEAPEVGRGGDVLLRATLQFQGEFFYYGLYYSTQGMFQLGGRHWKEWRKQVEPFLLSRQLPDGSWPAAAESSREQTAGPAFITGLAVQTLAVSYRLLPIYQR